MKKISLFILLVAVLLGGCESFFYQPAIKKENILLEKKIVMNALFNTEDDSLKVGLYWMASPLEVDTYNYYKGFDAISNAKVILSDGSNEVDLVYDETIKQFYALQSQMPLEVGKQYRLTAIADGLEVFATATVPHNNIAITAEKLSQSDVYSQSVELSLQDIAGEDNYFEIQSWALINEEYYTGGYIAYDGFGDFPCDLRSDYRNDGELLQYNIRYDLWGVSESDKIELFVRMYHITPDYYNYQEEVCWYIGSDPFIEPTQLYSNIENGVGIFAIAASQTIQL